MPKLQLKKGKHYGRDKDGEKVTFKAGDMVDLTAAQVKAFGDKFGPKTTEVGVDESDDAVTAAAEAKAKEEAVAQAKKALEDAQAAVGAAKQKVVDAKTGDAKKAANAELVKANEALAAAQPKQ